MTAAQQQENLAAMVDMLNDYSGRERDWMGKNYGCDDALQLRRVVRAWQEARSEGTTLLLPRMKLTPEDTASLNKATESMKINFRLDGALVLADSDASGKHPAVFRFLRLLRSTPVVQARLGGPCRNPRCNDGHPRWFVKRTRRDTIFCSAHCAGNATKANERARKREQLVASVVKAIGNYGKLPAYHRYRQKDWRAYVHEATGASRKFLTQILATGEIRAPMRGEHHATY